MKKLVSVLLALLLLSITVAAYGEVDMSDWVEVTMNDIGMHFYRPADMTVSSDPVTDGGENCAYIALNDQLTMAVYCIGTNDITLADLIDSLRSQGFTVTENALAEAGMTYAHLALTFEGVDNYAGIIFEGVDGCFYDFECEELADGGLVTFGMMLGTLSPIQ